MSLQYLLNGLDRSRYEPVVAVLPDSPEVLSYHRRAGCEVFHWPGIATFEHTTAEWTSPGRPLSWPPAWRTLAGWGRSGRRTMRLVDRVGPALVHLNSVVLSPSASALRAARIPFVWHVREAPPPGGGARTRWLGSALARWPSAAVFMTPRSRRAWETGGAGLIVPESVDLDAFSPAREAKPARARLGLPADARIVLFLGGMPEIKGIRPLVAALSSIRRDGPETICLMPGTAPGTPTPLARVVRQAFSGLHLLTPGQRLDQDLSALGDSCRISGFSDGVGDLLAASDLLVFPALRDHFARPIMEAQAAGRPVVASRLPLLEEMVEHGVTGLLVPPGNAASLATALRSLLADEATRRRMGQAGRSLAEARHDAGRNTDELMGVFDQVLARRVPGRP